MAQQAHDFKATRKKAMIENAQKLWTHLSASPLLWLTLTMLVFLAGLRIFLKSGRNPLLNPVMISVIALVGLLKATGTDYQTYFKGAQFIHFLLGPATVALAIPLYKQIGVIKKAFLPITLSLALGSLTGILSAVAIARIFGGDRTVVLSLAPKSITTPIAMAVSEQIKGLPSLTAVVVVLTGITGAVMGDVILNKLRIKDEMARGLAFGVAAHGIGTAHAIQASQVAGAFAGLAMGLNGLFTAIIMPGLIDYIN